MPAETTEVASAGHVKAVISPSKVTKIELAGCIMPVKPLPSAMPSISDMEFRAATVALPTIIESTVDVSVTFGTDIGATR
jgi:hypothetical protein